MGDSASQPNAQGLRNLLVGLSRFEQFPVAIQWAKENHCILDMFGSFAKDVKPKNVLASNDGLAIFVIDADISLV